MGQPRFGFTPTDRGTPFLTRLWVRPAPLYFLLIAVFLFTVAVSSTGLERPKYRTAYACEGSTLNMDCDQGHVINLIRANYGRFSITICNEHGNTEWSVNCMSLRSHRVLHDRCSQRQNCSVPASTRGFGDPCPGTLKYLEAHFQCVPVNPPSHKTRPRPPWFRTTKTTMSPLANGQNGPHMDIPFPRDPPQGLFPDLTSEGGSVKHGPDGVDESVKSSSSTTTTTLRPPPWLITNTTKNTTLSTTTTTTTSAPTTQLLIPTTTTTTTTTLSPRQTSQHELRKDAADDLSTTHSSPSLPDDQNELNKDDATPPQTDEGQKRRIVTPPTVSTTTLWSPQAEVPDRSGSINDEETAWCPPNTGRGLLWNWTRSGEVAVQPCPGGASGWATRPCSPLGWVSPPDLGECRSVWLSTLLTRAEAKDAVLAVAQDLTQVTHSRKLYGGDITAAARLVSELTRRMGDDVSSFPDGAQLEALVTELVMKALTTVSNLVGHQRPAWLDLRPSEHNAALTQLLLGLEEAAFFLADNIHHQKTITHAVPNILMRLQVLETRNVAAVTFPSADDPWPSPQSLSDPYGINSYPDERETFSLQSSEVPSTTTAVVSDPQRHLQDFITLPPEALLENSDNGLVKVVFFSYEGLEKLLQFQRNFGYFDALNKNVNRTRILNSRVVSASLGAGRHIELSEPVFITFAMIRTVNVTNPSCVFWDYTTSSWSEEGCRVVNWNASHVTCQCDHLTNFAILMDVHNTPISPRHEVALSVITYVGCVISIIGLLLATVVFHAFRALKSDRTTIHKNLCICLLLGEAIFVGGISRTDQPLVCSFVAGFLHYFFLAAFAWMFLEGFQLYMMMVEVFESEKSRVRWYYAVAYGFPALVVAISAVIDPNSYGTDSVCWLRTDNYFIFAFVGPVLLVLVANCIFLTLSLVLMCRHAQNSAVLKNKETSRLASLRSWIRGAVIMMFLLGLTWTFGLLYLDQASVVMAYVFTVLNSLQGLFIFIFHCLQNDKKYSFKSCGRDSGHGGSEQEESPRTGPPAKLSSLRLNNNVAQHQNKERPHLVNPFAAAAALEHSSPTPAALLPDYRLAGDTPLNLRYPATSLAGIRVAHRNQSPWNHTYTEIPDGIVVRPLDASGAPDPVYEEIEREGRSSEIQVSDMSDEDGRRQNSDISRQSSRSYGDHRPLLPYTLPDRGCPPPSLPVSHDPRLQPRPRHTDTLQLAVSDNQTLSCVGRGHPGQGTHFDHTIVSAGHTLPLPHPAVGSAHIIPHGNGHIGPPVEVQQYQEAFIASLGHHNTVVQPLSEPNLRSWEAVQRHRDLQQLQHLGEMTVAVLNGEQVVCKLKSPLAPIHENSSSQATTVATATVGPAGSGNSERFLTPQTYSHC